MPLQSINNDQHRQSSQSVWFLVGGFLTGALSMATLGWIQQRIRQHQQKSNHNVSNYSTRKLSSNGQNNRNSANLPTIVPTELRNEQLSRHTLYFGEDGMKSLQNAKVCIVGVGGVGSHAACMLARGGVTHLRLIDFDQVTLSSLNRHACATLQDVGIPKVICVQKLCHQLGVPNVDAIAEMYTATSGPQLLQLPPDQNKWDIIIDCIDDVPTKAALLSHCLQNQIRVLSCMGAGGKSDMTRLHLSDLRTASRDPLASKLRQTLKKVMQQEQQQQQQQQDCNDKASNPLREEIQPHRTPEKSKSSVSSFVQRTQRTQTPKARHDGQQNQQQNRPWNTEFREEDDMITLDTQSTFTKPASPIRHATTSTETKESPSQREDRSSFFARMEGMLNRVEESIMENPSPPRRYRGDEPSRPSDEIQASLSMMPRSEAPKQQYSHYQRAAHRSLYQEESYSNGSVNCNSLDDNEDGCDDEDDEDDSSTNMAPTLIAEKNQSFRHVASKSIGWSTDEKDSKRPHPLNTPQQQQQVQIQRPTHILVDRAISSPAHTNITMDATMMNDTFASFLGMDETQLREKMAPTQEHPNYRFNDDDTTDNLSTVTPVLDRYRLDPDDENSIGVKVVPNERGSHQKPLVQTSGQKQGSHPFMTSSSRPKTPKETATLPIFSASDFLSPQQTPTAVTARPLQQRTPGSISTQNKKVYRKTPFPKRKATHEQESNSSTFNENEHPNTSTGSSVAASPGVFQKSLAPIESISITVPPLRPRSLDSRRLEENFSIAKGPYVSFDPLQISNKHRSKNSTMQRIDQEENATIDQIDKTIERIDQELAIGGNTVEMVDLSSGRVDPVGKSFLSQVKSMTQTNTAARPSLKSSNLKKITVEEFEQAPRIVRTQVSVEEANHALDLLQEFCNHGPMEENPSLQFSEERGHEMLSSLTGSKHRSKSILISLCHWQRLSMRRDTVRGTMVFVVNSAAKDRAFLC